MHTFDTSSTYYSKIKYIDVTLTNSLIFLYRFMGIHTVDTLKIYSYIR